MCFIISIVLLVLGFNFYNAGNTLAAGGSFLVSLFFIYLMIQNIRRVKKLKEEEKNDDN